MCWQGWLLHPLLCMALWAAAAWLLIHAWARQDTCCAAPGRVHASVCEAASRSQRHEVHYLRWLPHCGHLHAEYAAASASLRHDVHWESERCHTVRLCQVTSLAWMTAVILQLWPLHAHTASPVCTNRSLACTCIASLLPPLASCVKESVCLTCRREVVGVMGGFPLCRPDRKQHPLRALCAAKEALRASAAPEEATCCSQSDADRTNVC